MVIVLAFLQDSLRLWGETIGTTKKLVWPRSVSFSFLGYVDS